MLGHFGRSLLLSLDERKIISFEDCASTQAAHSVAPERKKANRNLPVPR